MLTFVYEHTKIYTNSEILGQHTFLMTEYPGISLI